MAITKKRTVVRCAECGEDEDLSYIVWEDRPLCVRCFADAVSQYATEYPFLLAAEMVLDVVNIPEEETLE